MRSAAMRIRSSSTACSRVFQLSNVQAPEAFTGRADHDTWTLFAAFVGGAYVEVIAVWLSEPSPRSPESLIEILLAALPGWMLDPASA
jgi:hypothetical protein